MTGIPPHVACFWYEGARDINRARIAHFNSFDLDISGKSILETGSGGCGDITRNLLIKTSCITLNDPRQPNIDFAKTIIGVDLPSNNWDLNMPLPSEDMFDVVFSYGTLYHLHDPAEALRNLSDICKDFIIISTISNGCDDGLHLVHEEGFNQSVTKRGCRPGRNWVRDELRKHFEYVYFPRTQPKHAEFPVDWRQQPLGGGDSTRFVVIGSRKKLDNPLLTTETPEVYG